MSRTVVWVVLVLLLISVVVFAEFRDEELRVDGAAVESLRALRAEPKLIDIPGKSGPGERARLEPVLNAALDTVLDGFPTHRSRNWVLAALEPAVKECHLEDTEVRDRCVRYLSRALRAVGVSSSRGFYLRYFLVL